jgi:hypothetical protein
VAESNFAKVADAEFAAPFATVTVTPLEVVFCPSVSVAMAAIVCEPFTELAVFHEVENAGPVPLTADP